MNSLFLFIYSLIHFKIMISSSCLYDPSGRCLTCSFDYYESNLASYYKTALNMDLLLKENDCIQKQSTFSKRKILITNGNCSECVYDSYNKTYSNFFEALQNEFKIALSFFNQSLEIVLQDGSHYLLRKDLLMSEEELFRRSIINFYVHPLIQSAKIMMKTNEFYLFVSQYWKIENLIFDGSDLMIQQNNDPLACYNQINSECCDFLNFNGNNCTLNPLLLSQSLKKQNYGLFNIENIFDSFDDFIQAELIIVNCSFINFYPLNISKGFSSLIALAPISGNLGILNVIIQNSFFPNGIIHYFSHDYYDKLTDYLISSNNDYVLIMKKYLLNISIDNLNILGYNKLLIEIPNYSLSPLFFFSKFNGYLLAKNLFFDNFLINILIWFVSSVVNKSILILDHFVIENFNCLGSIMKIINLKSVLIMNLKFNDIQHSDNLFYFENINNLTFKNILISNSIAKNKFFMFKILLSNVFFENGLFLSLISTGFLQQEGGKLQLNSSVFNNSQGKEYFICFEKNEGLLINDAQFLSFLNFKNLIMIQNGNYFVLLNSVFNKIISCFFVIYLDVIQLNINNNITSFSNSVNYFWKNDQNCKTTILNNSLIFNNMFLVALYSNVALRQEFLIINSYIHNNNCSGISLFYFFWTLLKIENTKMVLNFLISDRLSDCIISAESFSDMIVFFWVLVNEFRNFFQRYCNSYRINQSNIRFGQWITFGKKFQCYFLPIFHFERKS